MRKLQAGSAAASLALVTGLVMQVSSAAFTDVTSNDGNEFSTGDVSIGDDDGASAMFTLADMIPGAPAETRCINVTYNGSMAAVIKMYGSATGSALVDYLNLTIERSTGAAGGATHDCTGFDDASKVVVHSPGTSDFGGFLASHSDFTNGADSRAVTGAAADTVSYRFTVSLQDDNNAQGRASTVSFTWESQNS